MESTEETTRQSKYLFQVFILINVFFIFIQNVPLFPHILYQERKSCKTTWKMNYQTISRRKRNRRNWRKASYDIFTIDLDTIIITSPTKSRPPSQWYVCGFLKFRFIWWVIDLTSYPRSKKSEMIMTKSNIKRPMMRRV